jgi:hypothetical protein
MALKVDATFENGVFVPANRPNLANLERVRLTIETAASRSRVSGGDPDSEVGSRTPRDLAIALDFHPDGC